MYVKHSCTNDHISELTRFLEITEDKESAYRIKDIRPMRLIYFSYHDGGRKQRRKVGAAMKGAAPIVFIERSQRGQWIKRY